MFRFLNHLVLTTLFALFASHASAMFIQPDWFDPTEPGVGTNRYAYSGNDPVNKLDPNGNNFIDKFREDFDDLFRNDTQRETINIERYNRTILALEELQEMYDDGNASPEYYAYYSDVLNSRLDRYAENLGRTKGEVIGEALSGASDIASLGSKRAATDATEGVVGMVSRTKTAARAAARRTDTPLTTAQASDLANWLGFQKVRAGSSPVKNSHGQPVFRSGNRYISPDVDGHKGGTWKVFDRRGNRVGTYNYDLSERVGD